MRKVIFSGLVTGIALLLSSCGGIHLFDKSQVPVITVGAGLQPEISWTPPYAYELHVYEGSENRNGFDVLWYARGGSDYENNLQSPVIYGVPPVNSEVKAAPPLEKGKTYTIVITRKDPKGSGDGFFNTRHRYEGQVTFVAQEK